IGGANIKFVCDDVARELPCQLWRDPNQLGSLLRRLAREHLGRSHQIGVTMTGELADCFQSKRVGVGYIVDHVVENLGEFAPLFYQTDGQLVHSEVAKANYLKSAASNWHALAWHQFFQSSTDSGFLIDVGSTTTDIIPVNDEWPVGHCLTDKDRLASGQLVYVGWQRTPACSLLPNRLSLDPKNESVGFAREFFATSGDAVRVLGLVESDDGMFDTADGRSESLENSKSRLARMVCCDVDEIGNDGVVQIAESMHAVMLDLIARGVKQVLDNNLDLPRVFRLTGGGDWLAKQALDRLMADEKQERLILIESNLDCQQRQCLTARAVCERRRFWFEKRGL
ncbi:MAG: hydantoinase/oxoprolinase family protein, partial [Planctomycetota bacterium]